MNMGSSLVITTGGIDTEEGNPNVEPSVVLQGYTVYGFDGEIQRGIMPDRTFSKESQTPGTKILILLGCCEQWRLDIHLWIRKLKIESEYSSMLYSLSLTSVV